MRVGRGEEEEDKVARGGAQGERGTGIGMLVRKRERGEKREEEEEEEAGASRAKVGKGSRPLKRGYSDDDDEEEEESAEEGKRMGTAASRDEAAQGCLFRCEGGPRTWKEGQGGFASW